MTVEVNRGYLDHIRRWSRPSTRSVKGLVKRAIQLLSIPLVILLAVALIVVLRLVLIKRPQSSSVLHEGAKAYVENLVEQYPLHLYPVVAKALELAYLKGPLGSLLGERSSVLEVAIGEGTLSARAFAERGAVTGLDLNPHSLARAAVRPHVVRAVVGDGLNPPVRAGAFDLVLSLNFLHHVTDKNSTLVNWGRIGRVVLFNENTRFWATGWPVPYLLQRLRLYGFARRLADRIEKRSMQHLIHRSALDRQVRDVLPVVEETSFMSERTFFLCGLFSLLMLCYGPPTPAIVKGVFLGVLRPVAIPLTISLARVLLLFDSFQDRRDDTFVFFRCDGTSAASIGQGSEMICARCASDLRGTRCVGCGTVFPEADGMLFLLPEQFAYVFDDYMRHEAMMPIEHL